MMLNPKNENHKYYAVWHVLFIFCIFYLGTAHLSLARGIDISEIKSPVKLSAIKYKDNGNIFGGILNVNKNSVNYENLNIDFNLKYYGKFNLQKMTSEFGYQKIYKDADGAYVYSVENWSDFKDIRKTGFASHAPRYVYIYSAKYIPKNKTAIFVCLISNEDIQDFYANASGHERCDAFNIPPELMPISK